MQDLEICLPTDLPTIEGYFSFQWSFKIVAFLYCHHKMKYYCFRVSFSVLIFKTELFINLVFGWGKCRTKGFIDGCVSCKLLQWTTGKIFCNNVSKFYWSCSSTAATKWNTVAIKSLLLFVYLVFDLRKATLWDATKVKVEITAFYSREYRKCFWPNLLDFRSCIQGDPEQLLQFLSRFSFVVKWKKYGH